MTMTERSVWATLIVFPLVAVAYLALILIRLRDSPVDQVGWVAPMLWAWGALVVSIVVGAIASAVATGVRAEAAGERAEFEDGDERDRQFEQVGNARAFTVSTVGGAAAIVLLMLDVDRFWPAHTLFLTGVVAGIVAAASRVHAYRTGF